nr:DUF3306 domain-containing protein [Ramlibacter algicola]
MGRWSRRKLDVKEGKAVEAEPVVGPEPSPQPSPASGRGSLDTPDPSPPATPAPTEPPPTLEDVQALTPASDFKRFVAPDVAPEVKNAALKKLFTDPHYNVMDGLDTYIDDYSKPDPMPESMLRNLASAKFLGLFREEEPEAGQAAEAGASTEGLPPETVAQSDASPLEPAPPEVPHADPDLRLQQDDAAEGGEPGHGAG